MDVPEFVIIRIEVESEPKLDPITAEPRKVPINKPLFYVEKGRVKS